MDKLGTTGKVVVGMAIFAYASAILFRVVPAVSPGSVAGMIPAPK